MLIQYNKPYILGTEIDCIKDVLQSGSLSGNGEYTKRCQDWLQDNLNVKKALLTTSCTSALEMTAILCDIQDGDEVIIPSYTFPSTANAFVLHDATPVFVDIRLDTLNINELLLEKAITERTKAIVAVHYAGVACEMDVILDIAKKHNLFVIEDAAQGIQASYKGKSLGSIGDFGTLSFHDTKNIIAGEGGALLINNEDFIERAEIIWEKGTNRNAFLRGEVDKYSWVDVGSSFLPSELISAFLYPQLLKSKDITNARLEIWNKYYNNIESTISRSNGHIFYFIHPKCDEILSQLREVGIQATSHYIPLHSSKAGMYFGKPGTCMNVTDFVSKHIVRLPLYIGMDIDFVIKHINRILNNVK